MGILDSLSKNPSAIALAALGIGLFIFRDKISGFFSDITGGAAGTAKIAETGGILAENLTSNLTLTPLPQDPLFGESGFFTNIAKSISNFGQSFGGVFDPNAPKASIPPLPFIDTSGFPTREESTDFTDVGMAAARARQDGGNALIDIATGFPGSGSIVRDLIETPFAVANVEETQAQFQERAGAFVEALPVVTGFTSLPGSFQGFGRQLSRNQEDFQSILDAEARRSETIFAGLFGNVQNPNF